MPNKNLALKEWKRGSEASKAGDHEAAITHFLTAVSASPENAKIRYGLGAVFWKAGRFEEAEAAYREAIRLGADNYKAYYDLIRLLRRHPQLSKSDPELEEERAICLKALALNPEDRQHKKYLLGVLGNIEWKFGLLTEAIAHFQAVVDEAPDDAEAHYNLGVTYRKAERDDEAEAAFREAIRLKPDYEKAYSYLVRLIGKHSPDQENIPSREESRAICLKALELKPKTDQAGRIYTLELLGGLEWKLNLLDEAIAHYREALEEAPENAKLHLDLGLTYYKAERFEEAEAAFREAVRLKTDYEQAYYNLVRVIGKVPREPGDVSYREESRAICLKALELKPRTDTARRRYILEVIGDLEWELNLLDECIAHYQEALADAPENAKLHYRLGLIYDKAERYKEAETAFREAIRLKPDYYEAYYRLACVIGGQLLVKPLREIKRGSTLQDARAVCLKALALEPKDKEQRVYLLGMLAALEWYMGHKKAAIAFSRETAELDPRAAPYMRLLKMQCWSGQWREMWETYLALTKTPDFDRAAFEREVRTGQRRILRFTALSGALLAAAFLIRKRRDR